MEHAAINSFDAVLGALALIAAAMGFMTGLMRSLATILGYLAAAPLAIVATPPAMALLAGQENAPEINRWVVFAAILVATGIALGTLLRATVTVLVGATRSMTDRCAGAVLGATRIGLVAVVVVLVFDRIIPRHLEPPFLAQSRLRPILSAAGATGVRSLPPEALDFIERIKRERGLL